DSGNGAGSFTFNPDYDQSGVYNVTFIASDGLLADSEVVQITVNDVNRAPVLDPIGPQVVDEGQSLEFRISATDPDLDAITLDTANVPLNATFVDSGNGAGSFTFNPDYDQAGVYNVTFIASDGLLADSEIVQITVNDVNRAPVLDPIGPQVVDEGQVLEFRISATDPDLDAITLDTANVPLNATFVDSGNGVGSFTFNPDYDQSGVYNVTFIASDGSLADSEVVQITVNDVNRAPVLDPIGPRVVDEGQVLEFRISATDPDLDAIALDTANVPLNATFVDSGNGAGSFTFNPDYDQSGVYNVTFIASDGSLADSEVVQMTVNDVNRAPLADAGPDQLNIDAGSLVTLDGSGSYDPDGDSIGYHWAQVFGPSVTLSDTNLVNPAFIPAVRGNYEFELLVDDGVLYSSPDTVLVSVSDQAPVLDSIGPKVVDEGQTLEFRISATDPDLDAITLDTANVPLNATFVDSGNGAGSFTFNPDYDQSGVYNVTFIASDGSLADSETVQITVNHVNLPPVLDSIGPRVVDEGQVLEFRVSAFDPDLDLITLDTLNVPANAVFVDSGDGAGSFTFSPDYDQAGIYDVTFIASDGNLADSEVVSITVNHVNRAPVLNPIGPRSVIEGGHMAFLVTASDPDDDPLVLSAEILPEHASFTDSGDGTGVFEFDPDYTQSGLYYVTFKVSDGDFADSEVVQITVIDAGNQAPVLDSIGSKTVAEAQTLQFRFHATDPDGDIPALFVRNNPPNSTFSDSGNGAGAFTFVPGYQQAGIYFVTFGATDGPLSDSEVVEITVTNVNRPPELDSIGPQSV
ncbi:MAG: tandem-95 repeat protein, partial [Gammaproteobacteria bacterium]|nr:tandem-95 repeat protein [Gammaproteobacteria bacterium]